MGRASGAFVCERYETTFSMSVSRHATVSIILRRYVEVDDVVLTDVAIRDWSPESVADGCADVVSDFPDRTTVSLAVNRRGTTPDGDGIRRSCKDALCATGSVVDGDSSEETEIQIDIIGDWAGISLKR